MLIKAKLFAVRIISNRFIKFLLVGGLNAVFGYGLFALFVYMGLHYTAAVFAAMVLGVLFNFKTTGILVFKNNNNRLILRFIAVYGVVYFCNITLIRLFTLCTISNIYIIGAAAVLPVAAVSYTLMRQFVFKGV